MKGRSVKLREAHKSTDGSATLCSVAWGDNGSRLVTAAASDPTILIHELPPHPSKQPKSISIHKEGVTCLALSPDSTCLASGSTDRSVKLHGFPSGEFQSDVRRFILPIRSLAFNRSGSLLAAAGDDDGIKLIATIDNSMSRVLKGHQRPVTGLSFDPNSEYLASVDAAGTVIFWELSSGNALHTLKSIAPDCGFDDSFANMLRWSPDGETLAVAGLKNDVVMYDRDTAEKLFTLRGEHEKPVCFMAWSPNGKYLATSSLDKQVLVWDIDLRQDIERQIFDERISSLAWKPNGNALAVIDVMGRFGVWDCPVPTSMKSPTDGASTLLSSKATGHLLFDDDDDDEKERTASGTRGVAGEDSYEESAPIARKRLRRKSLPDENVDDDSDGEESLLRQIESRKRSKKHDEKKQDGKEEASSSTRTHMSKRQDAFQPCSTPPQAGKRRFLCYNMLGTITTMENEGYSHIEVEFHDTGRGSRIPSMTDYFGFTMASLNEVGSVYANPRKGDKKTSTLMYKPFSSWANNSEWSMRFEEEEVMVVTLGTGWVAAVTDLNFVRVFTEGGLQKLVMSLDGPVVSAAGFRDQLAIVYHASDTLSSGDQMLEVKVFNIANGTLPTKCRLPLTPGSCLSWFGFSEEGDLSAYDSKGVLRVYNKQFGGSWVPLFCADKAIQSEDENYWIVGVNASKLFCIICKSPDLYPLVTPKPVLTLLSLSVPLAASDLGAVNLENELIMINLSLFQIQKKIEELAVAGQDTTTVDDEAFDMEAARDKCILRLIASCCNSDKLVRATELAKLLSLEKSIRGAIKLVTALKLPILAERFSKLLEERLACESGNVEAIGFASNLTVPASVTLQRVPPQPDRITASEPSVSLPPRYLSPQFSKQTEQNPKFEKQSQLGKFLNKDEEKKTEKSDHSKNSTEEKLKESSMELQPRAATNPFAKRKTSRGKQTGEEKPDEWVQSGEATEKDQVETKQKAQPVNPFAKTLNKGDKTSLDSIKNKKKAGSELTDRNNKRLKV